MKRLLITAILGCVLSGVFGYFLLPMLRALKAGIKLRKIGPTWHNQKAGTPVMGGLMFIAAALVCLLVNVGFLKDYTVFYVFVMALAFGAIGMVDDFAKIKHDENLGLTALQKLLLQMAVAALFVYVLYRNGSLSTSLYIPFVGCSIHVHPLLYVVLTMFIVVGCVNSVNLTDGIDGLCSSVTAVVAVFFSLVFLREGSGAAAFSLALAGGLFGFFLFNKHPARVFMGDTGSLFLGGAVCAMAFAYDMPLILVPVGMVYIIETLSDIIQVGYFKLSHGKRVFKMAPFHHHLEMGGWLGHKWKEKEIVALFTGISLVMAIISFIVVSKHYMGMS